MYLKENEKQQISKEIENLESQSSAELVAVITKNSSSYKFEIIALSLIVTTLISLIALIIDDSSLKLFQIQVLTFFTLFFLFDKFNKTLFTFLPKSYKHEKASKNARQQFLNLGLQRTKTKQAIMFFVSIDERYVEIITDSAIKQKIDDSYWQNIVDEFIKDVKNQKLALGYLKAIKSCNDILIRNFPIQKDDENELSNEVLEL